MSASPKNIRIQSDGTSVGTRVTDTETGEEFTRVAKIEWEVEAPGFAKATVTFWEVELDVVAKRTVVVE